MGTLRLIYGNLMRKKLRTLFTLASVIIAFVLFALLGGLTRAFSAGVELAGADRLVTSHRVSFIQLMPFSYVERVRGIDSVDDATHYTWFGAYFQDPKQQFALFPTDLDRVLKGAAANLARQEANQLEEALRKEISARTDSPVKQTGLQLDQFGQIGAELTKRLNLGDNLLKGLL